MDRPPAPNRDSGGRQPQSVVLVLPGMTLNGTIMPPLPVDSLAVDFAQFVPELPDDRITMGLYVERLRDVLAGESLWGRPRRIVVAHSFGGMLALQWLLDTPPDDARLPQGLVLVATTAGPMFDMVRLRIARIGGSQVRIGIRKLIGTWNHPIVTRAVKSVLSPSHALEGRLDFRSFGRVTDLAVDLAGWRNTDWRSMRTFRLAMLGLDLRDRLRSLALPVTILHGTDDALFPLDVARDLAARLPNARLRVVRGAGHVLPLTHGEAVVEAVEEMLGRSQESAIGSQESGIRSPGGGANRPPRHGRTPNPLTDS
jgi:pimeloyl-ACP methyl ester carboxylesterase